VDWCVHLNRRSFYPLPRAYGNERERCGGSIPPYATTVLTIKSGRWAKSIPEPLSAKAWIEGINKAERINSKL